MRRCIYVFMHEIRVVRYARNNFQFLMPTLGQKLIVARSSMGTNFTIVLAHEWMHKYVLLKNMLAMHAFALNARVTMQTYLGLHSCFVSCCDISAKVGPNKWSNQFSRWIKDDSPFERHFLKFVAQALALSHTHKHIKNCHSSSFAFACFSL